MNKYFKKRVNDLQKSIMGKGYDAFLIYNRADTLYFTGFNGSSSYTLITNNTNYFITDFRYIEYATNNIQGFKIIRQSNDIFEDIRKIIEKKNIKKIAIESNLPLNLFQKLKKTLSKTQLIPAGNLIESQRILKDESEIENIQKAASIADKVLGKIKTILKTDITEKETVRQIRWIADELGSEEDSFSPIVASGNNSSLPHHKPSNKKIQKGDSIILDLGCVIKGYHSDMTRTVFIDKVSRKMEKVYKIVLQAQESAIKEVKAGKKCSEIDKVARDIISSYGYGKYFGHGLGHGVGLEIQEPPSLNITSKYVLKEGMIITIEPGIYIPGCGGVRIEDLVLVTKTDARILSKSPKDLEIIQRKNA